MYKFKLKKPLSTGLLLLSSMLLSACGNSKLIACHGVSKKGDSTDLIANEGTCQKLAGTSARKLTPKEAKTAKPYPYSTYIKCYGVAAGGKNDCGTKTTACAGTVATARAADAWVAIPQGLCEKIKGGVVEKIKK